MSRRPRPIGQYPPEFWDLLESLLAGGSIRIPGKLGELISLRTQIYTFAKIVRTMTAADLAAEILKLRLNVQPPGTLEQQQLASTMAFRAQQAANDLYIPKPEGMGEGGLLVGSRAKDSKFSQMLRKATTAAPPPTTDSPAEDSLAKLRALLKEETKP